jgi:aminoglycoside phosphotransferase
VADVDFRRRRPSSQTLDWVERAAGGKVVAWRRMTGGTVAAVHRLTLERGGHRIMLVLRRYEHQVLAGDDAAALVRDEAAALRVVRAAGLPAPELVAADADGQESDGRPALLMTRLPGRPELTPADPQDWVRQIAAMAVRIHQVPATGRPFTPRHDALDPAVPESATRPAVWQNAFGILRQQPPEPATGFIHRDFQHFNLVWRRGRLTGVVDWAGSCTGPADFDLGHGRLNLAVLFGAGRAELLRLAYEAEAGRAVDPWWDLYAITAYNDGWRRSIPVQVAGRAPVDRAGMTARVEDLLEATLNRL